MFITAATRPHVGRRLLVLAVAVLYAGSAAAEPPGADDATPIVLKAARMFDATSDKLRPDAVIVVRGERIEAVGADASIPAEARIIDLGNATLLPGFIDSHAHLSMEPDPDYHRKRFNALLRPLAEQAFYAGENARRTLEAGFTTVRHMGGRDFIDVGLRNAIAAGLTEGPRILASGNPISTTGGSCDQPPFLPDRIAPLPPEDGICNGADECLAAVRAQMKWGADVIKTCASGGVLSYDPVDVPQLTAAEMTAIVSEAHKWGRKVAAHAHGDTAARLAIDAGVDSIEHGSFLTDDTLELMKRKSVFLVPTCAAIDWVERHADTYPPDIARKARVAAAAHHRMLRSAIRIGVPIALGTDITVVDDGHGKNAIEFVLMVELGMSPADALLAGTRSAATLLGLEDEIGTLEAGKLADIVAVPDDPLEDMGVTRHPLFVMQRGSAIIDASGSAGGKRREPAP